MKKVFIILLLVLIPLFVSCNNKKEPVTNDYVWVDYCVLAPNTPYYYTYDENGNMWLHAEINPRNADIIGEASQWIKKGDSATTVTVVPKKGYRFVKWTDTESTNPTRTDYNIDKALTAGAVLEGPYSYDLYYSSDSKGGTIEGETTQQNIVEGTDGTPVIAIPDEDFRFIKWSDGVTTPTRPNQNVMQDVSGVKPIFERYQRTMSYECNEGTLVGNEKEVTLLLDELNQTTLPIPTREGYTFEGWYSDWHHTIQVADKTGKVIVGKEWLDNDYYYGYRNPKQALYAKWKPINAVPTYKVLLIFVTEIHAELKSTLYGMKKVDYVMSEGERKICESVVGYVEDYLNALLNGTVNFEVDSYFTKEPLGTENFNPGNTADSYGNLVTSYGIEVGYNDLPEVNDLVKHYSSVLTTFSLNDPKNQLHVVGGSAGKKYGFIHLEDNLQMFRTLDEWNDFNKQGIFGCVEAFIESYIHEFTHTVEMQIKYEDLNGGYGLHKLMEYYSHNIAPLSTIFSFVGDFLRMKFCIDGQYVGIPYEFWTGEYFKE